MPKYPWKSYSPLRTHEFDDGVFRDGVDPGHLFVCRNCHRRFKFDSGAHRTWAVGKGRRYLPLQDAVSGRWISEPCSGGPNAKDEEDSARVKLRLIASR
jgi:hypothetical protein